MAKLETVDIADYFTSIVRMAVKVQGKFGTEPALPVSKGFQDPADQPVRPTHRGDVQALPRRMWVV